MCRVEEAASAKVLRQSLLSPLEKAGSLYNRSRGKSRGGEVGEARRMALSQRAV